MLPDSAFRSIDKIDVNYKRMHLTVKNKKCGARIAHRRCGGLEGIRTLDFYNANVALSQLSYEPLYGANTPITNLVYY